MNTGLLIFLDFIFENHKRRNALNLKSRGYLWISIDINLDYFYRFT